MDLLKGVVVFVGWLSGSLAAITAMLYAFGYLATLSNLHALGLDPAVLEFDPLFYLQRGSSFALYLLKLNFNTILSGVVPLVILVISGLLVYQIWVKDHFSPESPKIFQRFQHHWAFLRILAFSILILLIFLHLWPTYENLTKVLTISDLLFEPDGADTNSNVKTLRDALTKRDEDSNELLSTQFYFAQLFLLEVAILFYVSWRLALPWRLRTLVVAPFALLFLMFFGSIPMIYGVVVLRNEFPTVQITSGEGNTKDTKFYYLLNKTSQEFIVWDDETNKIVWLPLKSVTRAEIGRRKLLPFGEASNQQQAR